MTVAVVDDHLLRDVLTGQRPADLGGIASSLATTGLWLFRLSSAWAAPERVAKLTAAVAVLPVEQQDRFLEQLSAATVEALAADRALDAAICVSSHEVAPTQGGAEHDGVAFHVL